MFNRKKKTNSKPIEGLTEFLGCTPIEYSDSQKYSSFKNRFSTWCERFTKSTEIDDRNSDYADPTISNLVDYEITRLLLEKAEHEFSIENIRTKQFVAKSQLESEIIILRNSIADLKEELNTLKDIDKNKNHYS